MTPENEFDAELAKLSVVPDAVLDAVALTLAAQPSLAGLAVSFSQREVLGAYTDGFWKFMEVEVDGTKYSITVGTEL